MAAAGRDRVHKCVTADAQILRSESTPSGLVHDQQQLRLQLASLLPTCIHTDEWIPVSLTAGNELGLWQRSAYSDMMQPDTDAPGVLAHLRVSTWCRSLYVCEDTCRLPLSRSGLSLVFNLR